MVLECGVETFLVFNHLLVDPLQDNVMTLGPVAQPGRAFGF